MLDFTRRQGAADSKRFAHPAGPWQPRGQRLRGSEAWNYSVPFIFASFWDPGAWDHSFPKCFASFWVARGPSSQFS